MVDFQQEQHNTYLNDKNNDDDEGDGRQEFFLNIFERAVQDPCSEDCDCDDEDYFLVRDLSRRELNDDTGPLDETPELPEGRAVSGEVECNSSQGCRCRHRYSRPGLENRLQRAVTTSSINTSPALLYRQTSPGLSPSASTMARPSSRSRANSTSLIRQLSRQSDYGCTALGHAHRSDSANNIASSPVSVFSEELHGSRRGSSVNRSRSSCSGIPTHLYGLEKYVSTALDAISTSDYVSHHTSSGGLSSPESSSSSTNFNGNNPQSDLSLSSMSTQHTLPSKVHLAKKGRKKSFIEVSLSNSFSQ